MRRLDRLVIKELLGPWVFGVAMFTTLLIAATYLNRIADYIVQGVPAGRIGEIVLLLSPAILVKTFAMSTLLAALLAFGRLSGDSEIVALRAAGASLWRILLPVILFASAAAGVSFVFNEALVPAAAKRSTAIAKELANSIKGKSDQPIAQPQIENGRVTMMIVAREFSLAQRALRGVTLVLYDKEGKETWFVLANQLVFRARNDWRIEGGAEMLSRDGSNRVRFDSAWPTDVPMLKATPEQLAASGINDPDFSSMAELREQIDRAKRDGTLTDEQIRNREYWYWNKLALPLAALMFGSLGAGLGIRSARTGTATGFALAIGILFGYLTLGNFMNVWAMGGVIPAWLASFTPIVLGAAATVIVVARKNR